MRHQQKEYATIIPVGLEELTNVVRVSKKECDWSTDEEALENESDLDGVVIGDGDADNI
jgi:hypothetical protein